MENSAVLNNGLFFCLLAGNLDLIVRDERLYLASICTQDRGEIRTTLRFFIGELFHIKS